MQCLEGDASQLDRLLGVHTRAQLGQTEAVGQGGGHLQYRAVQCEVGATVGCVTWLSMWPPTTRLSRKERAKAG